MAKQLIIERKAAPSLCMSMKISPMVPSSYSPVRRKTLFPATRASWVKPLRRAGRRRRTGCASDAAIGAFAVERHCLDAVSPALLIGVEHVVDRRLVRHVDRLGDGAGEEALRGAHHPDVAHMVDE